MNHRISMINFGDKKLNDQILERFGFSEHSAFNRMDELKDNIDKERKSYDYFIKLIPHLFVDEIRNEDYIGYEYSLSSRARDYDADSREMPIIQINYDMSPITMKITLFRKSFAHTLTHVCAIVGGVYVIFSMLNRFLLAFCDISVNDRRNVVGSAK